jgi:hypothetical protein
MESTMAPEVTMINTHRPADTARIKPISRSFQLQKLTNKCCPNTQEELRAFDHPLPRIPGNHCQVARTPQGTDRHHCRDLTHKQRWKLIAMIQKDRSANWFETQEEISASDQRANLAR